MELLPGFRVWGSGSWYKIHYSAFEAQFLWYIQELVEKTQIKCKKRTLSADG